MAEYTVRIVADTKEADEKVKKLDREVIKVTEERKLNLTFPSFGDVIANIQTLGRVIKQTWDIAGKTPLLGGRIQDLQEVLGNAIGLLGKVAQGLKLIGSLTPKNILAGAFTGSVRAADEVAKRVANIGFTLFGVTQSVNVLKSAFGSFFNDTIGREIRLQESLLRTKTTLASTADVAVNGKRITDPYEAILKLEGPIEETLQNIRVRSLDIAGTTSDAIVQVFGVVASQIGNVGGSLKDAEDLAITFSAALGTLGLADPVYAAQEIRSILTGTIDQNSILARSLGLTNEDVAKAKNSTEGLVAFINRRLAAFTAGQAIAAQGFAGITSNIEEFAQEVKRSFGAGLLGPLLEGLTVLYTRLQLVFKSALGIGDALGRTFGAVAKGVVGAAAAAPSLKGFTERKQIKGAEKAEDYSVDLLIKTQKYIDGLRPAIASLTDEAVKAVAMLATGLKTLAEGFAKLKSDQIELFITAFTGLAGVLNNTVVPAFAALMTAYGELLKQDIVQVLNAAAIDFGLLEKVGVMPLVRTLFVFSKSIFGAWSLLVQLKNAVAATAVAIQGALTTALLYLAEGVFRVIMGLQMLMGALVTLGTQGVIYVLAGLQSLAIGIQSLLVQLASFVAVSYPALASLVTPILQVANAFSGFATVLGKAGTDFTAFSLQAAAQLDKLGVAAEAAKLKISGLGTSIKEGADKIGKGLGGAMWNIAKGFAIFFVQMALVQLLVLGVYELIKGIQQKQKEISDKTRAEIAVKRLSTVYAELGENASAAAKAMREIEEGVITSQIDNLKKKIGELSEKLKEVREMRADKNPFTRSFKEVASSLNLANLDVKPQKTGEYTQESFIDALIRTRTENVKKLQKELQSLADFEDKRKGDTAAKENVEILSKERRTLEKELGEVRKEINKQLLDVEWSEKQKILSLEQQMKEAMFSKERSALEERQRLENQNLGSIGASYAAILDEYQKGVFDAQVDSQKRQFDFATQQAELEKQVSDYRIRLEEQTLKLRAKMGEMNRKIVDYEAKERVRAAKEVLKYTLLSAAKQSEPFVVGPEETSAFNNAAAKQGVSATGALAYLKMGAMNDIGASSSTPVEPLLKALAERFPFLSTAGLTDEDRAKKEATMRGKLQQRGAALGQQGLGAFAYDTALSELGNARFLKSAPPTPPPSMAGLETFIDVNRDTDRLRANLTKTLNKAQEYLNMQNKIAINAPFEQFAKQINDPSLWGLEKKGELEEQLKQLAANAALTSASLDKGQLPTKLESLQSNLKTFLDIIIDTQFNKYLGRFKPGDPARQKVNNSRTVIQGASIDELRQQLPILAAKPGETYRQIAEVIKTFIKFYDGLPKVAAAFNNLAVGQAKAALTQARTAAADLRPRLLEAFTEFGEMVQSMIPGGYSLDKANMRSNFVAQTQTQEQLMGLSPEQLQDPAAVTGVLDEGEKLRQQYEKVNIILDPVRSSLENFRTRLDLAASATQIFRDAHRSFIEELISGSGDMGDAITNFGESISKNFLGKFLDFALKPMEDQMFGMFKNLFGVHDAEEEARKALQNVQSDLATKIALQTTAVEANTRALTGGAALGGIGGPEENAATSGLKYGYKIGETVGAFNSPTAKPTTKPSSVVTLPVQAYGEGSQPFSTPYTPGSSDFNIPKIDTEKYSNALKDSAESIKAQGTEAAKTAPKTNDWGKALGGATQALAGIAMGIAGAQQMSEGGTYNTLMGLAGIFGALGSITGMFGTGGVFAAKKASGGPVSANRPYLVGEIGPELFLPNSDGEIVSNAKSRKLMSAAALAGKSQTFASNAGSRQKATPSNLQFDFAYQSEVINNVEYVTTDQFRKGMSDSAERGKNMAFQFMQNNVSTRRRLGL